MERNSTPPPTRLHIDFLHTLFSEAIISAWASDYFWTEDEGFWYRWFWCQIDRSHPQIRRHWRQIPMHLFSESCDFNKVKFLSAWATLFRKLLIFVISAKNGFQAAPRKTFEYLSGFFEVPEITFWAKPFSLRQSEAPKRSKKSRKRGKSLKVFKTTSSVQKWSGAHALILVFF